MATVRSVLDGLGAVGAHGASHAPDAADPLYLLGGMIPGPAAARVETFDRGKCQGNVGMASGARYWTFFRAGYSLAGVSRIRTWATSGAASSTGSRLALATVAGNGDLTLIARTDGTAGRWAATGEGTPSVFESTGGWPATVDLVRGQLYAVGFWWAGTGAPPSLANYNLAAGVGGLIAALAPRMTGVETGGGDFPAAPGTIIPAGQVAGAGRAYYASLD